MSSGLAQSDNQGSDNQADESSGVKYGGVQFKFNLVAVRPSIMGIRRSISTASYRHSSGASLSQASYIKQTTVSHND